MFDALAEYRARADKFWSFVERGAPDECWLWTASRTEAGYGRFYLGKAVVARAHRVAFALANGRLAAPHLKVCHRCDNPPCCNPAHLWEGTDADNNRDRAEKGRTVRPKRDESAVRYARGERHGSAKLTGEQATAIRQDPRSLSQVAAAYGISVRTASRIRNRTLWKDVP